VLPSGPVMRFLKNGATCVCCSVLQCVAVCCNDVMRFLENGATCVCCSVMQCSAVYCNVFWCVTVCWKVL